MSLSLLRFLTPKNLQYLDMLLRVILDERSAAYRPVWGEFGKIFEGFDFAVPDAIKQLKELHQIVKGYRRR